MGQRRGTGDVHAGTTGNGCDQEGFRRFRKSRAELTLKSRTAPLAVRDPYQRPHTYQRSSWTVANLRAIGIPCCARDFTNVPTHTHHPAAIQGTPARGTQTAAPSPPALPADCRK